MEPHLGAGAGQAMEVRTIIRRTDANSSAAKDAFVLGRLLAHPLTTLSNVSTALKAYQDVRLPFAQFVARESERNGYLMSLDAHGYYDADRGNGEPLDFLKGKILSIIDEGGWEGEGDAIAEWLQAEKKLRKTSVCTTGTSE
jgi:salicylate hydroxylase